MHNAWTVTGTFLWPEQCHILVGEGKCPKGKLEFLKGLW